MDGNITVGPPGRTVHFSGCDRPGFSSVAHGGLFNSVTLSQRVTDGGGALVSQPEGRTVSMALPGRGATPIVGFGESTVSRVGNDRRMIRTVRRGWALVTLAALLVLGGCTLRPARAPGSELVTVVRVADGDTLTIRIEGKDERVRLLGIDAPEVAHDGQPAECGANTSRDRLRQLVGGGKVSVASDPISDERDRHGRLLAYVTTTDGVDVGLALIGGGFADAWYPVSEPQPSRFVHYKAAEVQARAERVGLWSKCSRVGR